MTTVLWIEVIAAGVVVPAIALVVVLRSIARVPAHEALVLSGPRERVSFQNTVVLPLLYHPRRIDLRVQPITFSRRGRDSLHCKDGVRVELDVVVLVQIKPTTAGVLRVVAEFGDRANDPSTLYGLFEARVIAAIKTAVAHVEHRALAAQLTAVKDRAIAEIGTDLGGFTLLELALVHLATAPKSAYDASSILDAEGLRVLGQA